MLATQTVSIYPKNLYTKHLPIHFGTERSHLQENPTNRASNKKYARTTHQNIRLHVSTGADCKKNTTDDRHDIEVDA